MSSYFLFARPSFISGVSRVLDLGSTLNEYNSCIYPKTADYLALSSDWHIVGSDIFAATTLYESQMNIDGEEE